jgi:hypothetical protein
MNGSFNLDVGGLVGERGSRHEREQRGAEPGGSEGAAPTDAVREQRSPLRRPGVVLVATDGGLATHLDQFLQRGA